MEICDQVTSYNPEYPFENSYQLSTPYQLTPAGTKFPSYSFFGRQGANHFSPFIFTSPLNYLLTDIQTEKHGIFNEISLVQDRTTPDGADLVQNVDGAVRIQCGVVQNWGDSWLTHLVGFHLPRGSAVWILLDAMKLKK